MILSRVSVQRDPTFHTRLANCVQNLCDHAQNSVSAVALSDIAAAAGAAAASVILNR